MSRETIIRCDKCSSFMEEPKHIKAVTLDGVVLSLTEDKKSDTCPNCRRAAMSSAFAQFAKENGIMLIPPSKSRLLFGRFFAAIALVLTVASAAYPCGAGRNSNLNSCTTTANCDGSTTNVDVQPAKVVIVSKVGKILCRKCNTKGQRCHGCTLNFVAEEAK